MFKLCIICIYFQCNMYVLQTTDVLFADDPVFYLWNWTNFSISRSIPRHTSVILKKQFANSASKRHFCLYLHLSILVSNANCIVYVNAVYLYVVTIYCDVKNCPSVKFMWASEPYFDGVTDCSRCHRRINLNELYDFGVRPSDNVAKL